MQPQNIINIMWMINIMINIMINMMWMINIPCQGGEQCLFGVPCVCQAPDGHHHLDKGCQFPFIPLLFYFNNSCHLKTIILILILWNTTSLTSSLTRFLWQGQELRSEKVSSVGDNLSPASLVLRNISRSYRVIISVIIIISLSFTISAFSTLWSQLSVNTNGLTKIFCFCQRRDAWLTITVIIMVSFIINFNKIIIIPKKKQARKWRIQMQGKQLRRRGIFASFCTGCPT